MKRCYIKSYLNLKFHQTNELNLYLIKNLKRDNLLRCSGKSYFLLRKNFCIITGRARSVHFLFKIARMELKNLMSLQLLMGIRKAN